MRPMGPGAPRRLAGGISSRGTLASEKSETAFFDAVEDEIASVVVVVEDAEGIRVSGLDAADFEIIEDRVSQPITYFSFLDSLELSNPDTVKAESGPAKVSSRALNLPPGMGASS